MSKGRGSDAVNGLPYYKAYPRDFIEGTIGMRFELKGAYRLVLDLIYMQGGKLPDDARYISGLLGCSVRAWNSFRAELLTLGKIEITGEFLRNYRADKELESLAKLQDNQRQKRTGWRKNKDLQEPQFVPTEPEPDTEVKEETIVSSKKPEVATDQGEASQPEKPPNPPDPRKPQRRACLLPPDWVPSDRNLADAQARNFTDEEIHEQAAAFRDYHLARGTAFKDWDAGWRTWLGNARSFGRTAATRNTRPRSAHDGLFDAFQRAAGRG